MGYLILIISFRKPIFINQPLSNRSLCPRIRFATVYKLFFTQTSVLPALLFVRHVTYLLPRLRHFIRNSKFFFVGGTNVKKFSIPLSPNNHAPDLSGRGCGGCQGWTTQPKGLFAKFVATKI